MKTEGIAVDKATSYYPEIHNPQQKGIQQVVGAMLVAVCALVTVGIAAPARADSMHARSILGLQETSDCKDHNGKADAYLKGTWRKSKWIQSHEELSTNYIIGNAGIGHAHHHSRDGCKNSLSTDSADVRPNTPPSPVGLGLPGTSLFVLERWLPDPAGNRITVSLSPDSFVQVDMNQLTPTNPLTARADLAADGGLSGSIILSAWMDDDLTPHVETHLTGIFEGLQSDLVSHSNGVMSLQVRGPMSWTVPGKVETFDTEIESLIQGVNDIPPSIR